MTTRDTEHAARNPLRDAVTPPKRPYRPPRLITYGNLRQLALAKAGSASDGKSVPSSKA
jgi:hypothetical protein